MLVESALLKAIQYCGSKQKALADLICEEPDKISYWLNRVKRIPFHSAVAIEQATQGKVSRYDLAPYARISRNPIKEYKSSEDHLTISERVAIGLSIEKSLGNRRGVRNDLISDKKRPELRLICTQVKGKTSDLAAKEAGFNSRDTYLRAKKVITLGVFQLVEAMDKQEISIATAAALAELTPVEQELLLSKDKKEMLALIQRKASKNISPPLFLVFLKDNALKKAEQQHQIPLRLVLLVLLLQSNSKGYFPWQTDQLKNNLFYYVQIELNSVFDRLIELGWIEKIRVKEKFFGQLIKREDK